MAMPLSLSANTSTSSGASGGYAESRGVFAGTNITNVSPDAAGNILLALTGAQTPTQFSPFPISGESSTALTIPASTAGGSTLGFSPTEFIVGAAALGLWIWAKHKRWF